MKNIIGVRFKKACKIYFFDSNNIEVLPKDDVVVELEQGYEYGEVVVAKREVEDEKAKDLMGKLVRKATKADKQHYLENKEKEKKAFGIALEKIKEHKLKMKLVDVEYKFDNTKITFSFTADGRIDFRELVRDLASVFKTRIELRQIGIRDEVKRIGGNGICGRELCCCSYLKNFETVSIKMAKEQNIVLNPSKITGNCGRLMCCLKYEEEVYEEKNSRLPKIGAIVKTVDGNGEVCGVETLAERIRVRIGHGEDVTYKKYNINDVKVIKNSSNKKDELVDNVEDKEDLKELERLEKLEKEEY